MLCPILTSFFGPTLLTHVRIIPCLPLSGRALTAVVTKGLTHLSGILHDHFNTRIIVRPRIASRVVDHIAHTRGNTEVLRSIVSNSVLPPLSLLLLRGVTTGATVTQVQLSTISNTFATSIRSTLSSRSIARSRPIL